jgi:8-oxo-dGTP pyrophosphatase MutT (NUDIX family)
MGLSQDFDPRPADFSFTAELRTLVREHLSRFEPRLLSADGLRHAAVGVVLLADNDGRTCFVLTRRLSTLRRHAGQWALPGGRLEPGEDSEAAALREIHEEINLELPSEALLGRLDDFVTRSGHLVSPLVFWSEGETALVASPDEVDAAFRIPLSDLDHPEALRLRPLLHFSIPSVPTTVHAPTAAILYQFREVALHGREVRVANTEQPLFAWR